MSSDELAVRALHAGWIDAVNAGELDRLLGWLADDVVLMGPGQAPFGRDGFRAGFLAGHERFVLRCSSDIDQLTVTGDVAVTVCRDALALSPRDGGAPMALAGHRLTVYRRQADGRWLLARDAHTLVPVG